MVMMFFLLGALQPEAVTASRRDLVSFAGDWRNTNDDERAAISSIAVRVAESKVRVQAWGNCRPVDCDWGEEAGVVYPGVAASQSVVSVLYQTSYSNVIVLLSRREAGLLHALVLTKYMDGRGLSDYAVEYDFVSTGRQRDELGDSSK